MHQSLFVALIGWSGTLFLSVVVLRTLFTGVARMYPWFFSYVAYVLVSSVMALWIHAAHPRAYPGFYWISEAVALSLGIGISFEMLAKAFAAYDGIRKLALGAFRILLAAVVLRLALLAPSVSAGLWIALERDVRTLQALMLIAISLLCLYFSITLNRNLIGIVCGYGLFVCCSVINLTLRSHVGSEFQTAWSLLQPLQYCLCELIWCVSLWKLERPVVVLAIATGTSGVPIKATLQRLRGYLDIRSPA